MATIITKNSSTASSVPLNTQLVQGELAVNVTDKRLFTENASGTVVELGTNPSSLTLPNGVANAVCYLNGSKVLTTGSALQFDGTNLGLGVTPSAWSSYRALQLAGGGSLVSFDNAAEVWSNAFFNGSNNVYIANGFATRYHANNNGAHAWYTAPSGTAGAAITFTQAMTLDASGRLGIGTTSPGADLSIGDTSTTASRQIRLHGPASGTAGGASVNVVNGTNTIFAAGNASNIIGGAYSSDAMLFWGNAALRFYGNSNELARIDSSGNWISSAPTTPPTLATNGTMVFNLTSNTNLRVSVRGSDGVTRVANITLA